MQEILEKVDLELFLHLKSKNLSFTRLSWGIISTLFTSIFPREALLTVIDTLLANPDSPELSMFMVLGYLLYSKPQLMKFEGQKDLNTFFAHEHTVNTGKFVKLFMKLHQEYKHMVRYEFKCTNFSEKKYVPLSCSLEAIKICETKRKIELEEYQR